MESVTMVPSAGPDSIASLERDVASLWEVFRAGRTRPLEWRLEQIDAVARFLRSCEHDILGALREDLGKPAFEAYLTDVGSILAELNLIRKRLPGWTRPQRIRTPLRSRPAISRLYPEPWGAVLLLPAWNYPVALSLLPLLGAMAGGNTVALKPSEMAPASASVVSRLTDFVDDEAIQIFQGGPETAEELLRHRWGHIHYTGSARVGRLVMAAAARNLTPVTLELGGKNPAYVHRDANVDIAARRIMFGRLFNAGQTCISPDYVLVDRAVEERLIATMSAWVEKAYGPDPRRSPDLARMVNTRQFDRVVGLLDGAGEIVFGGNHDRAELYVAPTIVRGVADDHPIMGEEIFGPVLPVISVDGSDAAIASINTRPQPLTMYIFTRTDVVAEQIIAGTSAGSVVVNQMFTQAANTALPFGGVGESGMGTYTGVDTFRCFTHTKPVTKSPFHPDPPLIYPPYSRWKERLIRRLLR